MCSTTVEINDLLLIYLLMGYHISYYNEIIQVDLKNASEEILEDSQWQVV